MGNFIGSHPECFDLGEYFGFYLGWWHAPQIMRRVPSPVKDGFLRSLGQHALEHADALRDEAGARFWCDQTPWNLRVAEKIVESVPDALFVLMLRNYRGVVMSLRQSFADGYGWAGHRIDESARLWADSYAEAKHLPPERTIAVSYDRLCVSPQETIAELERDLSNRLGVDAEMFQRSALATRYARSSFSRNDRTIAKVTKGQVEFTPVPAYDFAGWGDGMEAACFQYVEKLERELNHRFGDLYKPALPSSSSGSLATRSGE